MPTRPDETLLTAYIPVRLPTPQSPSSAARRSNPRQSAPRRVVSATWLKVGSRRRKGVRAFTFDPSPRYVNVWQGHTRSWALSTWNSTGTYFGVCIQYTLNRNITSVLYSYQSPNGPHINGRSVGKVWVKNILKLRVKVAPDEQCLWRWNQKLIDIERLGGHIPAAALVFKTLSSIRFRHSDDDPDFVSGEQRYMA